MEDLDPLVVQSLAALVALRSVSRLRFVLSLAVLVVLHLVSHCWFVGSFMFFNMNIAAVVARKSSYTPLHPPPPTHNTEVNEHVGIPEVDASLSQVLSLLFASLHDFNHCNFCCHIENTCNIRASLSFRFGTVARKSERESGGRFGQCLEAHPGVAGKHVA